ncbi:SixA phosphatase family protein [Mariniradius sediminis]|uniref:Histidine phosphatase family protein n=1 Tax=Mariniradius sediminis TaxID=2909237 RepID=A0ABS9BSC1_9BACT|nr:histidine phosphatase family protein [Mariniradius sediminis]MCF1750969.1 histidine phosphatase family protein [Mariniradius sediminis]
MLALYLLRHGESTPVNSVSGDIGRNLTSTGREKLLQLAKLLKRKNINFDHLLVSPAKRTMETKSVLESELGDLDFEIDESLYEGIPRALIDAICRQPKEFKSILLVGHNPGISAVASYFSGDNFISLSPGMMAIIYFNLEDWKMLSANSGTLMEILH